jgi:UPF0755 protein
MSDPFSGLLGADEGERRPPRRPVPPPRRRPAGFGRLFLAIIVMAGLVAAVIFGGKALITNLTHSKKVADYAGQGTGSVDVSIKTGQSATAIGNVLVSQDVVKSVEAFTAAANADPDRAAKIQPGNYILRLHMSGAAAFNLLFSPSARDANPFTIAEGLDMQQALPIIAKATGLKLTDLQNAADHPTLLGLPTWAAGVKNAEGFLFPATYAPRKSATALVVLRSMVARFNVEAQKLNLVAAAQADHITPLQAVTLASIVEKEVNKQADQGKAARVLYNRLADTADFPTLGMDSTTRYALGGYSGILTQSQLAFNSPYNTRVSPGIPPGPIGNPGESTLKAVLAPTPGDWTFFIYLPKEKQTLFTDSSSQFYTWQQQYLTETGGG